MNKKNKLIILGTLLILLTIPLLSILLFNSQIHIQKESRTNNFNLENLNLEQTSSNNILEDKTNQNTESTYKGGNGGGSGGGSSSSNTNSNQENNQNQDSNQNQNEEQIENQEHSGWIAFSSSAALLQKQYELFNENQEGNTINLVSQAQKDKAYQTYKSQLIAENNNIEEEINSFIKQLRIENKESRERISTPAVKAHTSLTINMFVLEITDKEAKALQENSKFSQLSFSPNAKMEEEEINQEEIQSQLQELTEIQTNTQTSEKTKLSTNEDLQGQNLAVGMEYGLTGQGIKIGLLGNGVDFTHKDFGCSLIMTLDSDSGDDKYNAGTTYISDTLRQNLSSYSDYCSDANTLVEYYATNHIGENVLNRTYNCTSGCSAGKCLETGPGISLNFNPYTAIFNNCTNKFLGGRIPITQNPSYVCNPSNPANQKYCSPYDIYSSGWTTTYASIISGKLDNNNNSQYDEGDYFGVAPDSKLYVTIDYYISEWILSTEEMMDPNHDGNISDKMDIIYSSLSIIPSSSTNLTYIHNMMDNVVNSGVIYTSLGSSAGPGLMTIRYPGAHDRAIAIGGVDRNITKWISDNNGAYGQGRGPARFYPDGSEYIAKPDLVSYGNVFSALRQSNDNHTYRFGVSTGASITTGIIALLKQKTPNINEAKARELLVTTTDNSIGNNFFTFGYGLMNITKVLTYSGDYSEFDYTSKIRGPNYALWNGTTNPCPYMSGTCPATEVPYYNITGVIDSPNFKNYTIEIAKVRNFYSNYNISSPDFKYDSRFVNYTKIYESSSLPSDQYLATNLPIPSVNGFYILKLTINHNDGTKTEKYNAIENWKGVPQIEIISPLNNSIKGSNLVNLSIIVREEPWVLDYGSLTIRYNLNGGPDTTMSCTNSYYVQTCNASNVQLVNGTNNITFWARNAVGKRNDVTINVKVINSSTLGYERNGIIWAKQDESGKYTWEEAISACENKTVEGIRGWRLPTIAEIGDGRDDCWDSHTCSDNETTGICKGSQADALIPDFALNDWYWSSTPMERANEYKCVAGFGTGWEVVPNPKPRVGWLYWMDNEHTIIAKERVRCVLDISKKLSPVQIEKPIEIEPIEMPMKEIKPVEEQMIILDI